MLKQRVIMTGALFNTLIMEGLHGKTSLLQVTLVMPQIIQVHTPTSMKIHIPFGIAARRSSNTWWQEENFDLSFLYGENDVRIRFFFDSDGSVIKTRMVNR